MRHFLGNLATYAIALLLFAGAGVFAWLRSAQVVLTREAAVVAAFDPRPGAPFEWRALGASSYARNCANCHGRGGEGWDQYPALDGAGRLFAAPGGREHLVDVHLYGLDSPRWRAPMPPMGHLGDVETAAVINYVLTRFGSGGALPPDARLLHPDDVADRRGLRLRPGEVERGRPVQEEGLRRGDTGTWP